MSRQRVTPPKPHPALIQHAQDRALYLQNRIADRITAYAGSMHFVYLHIALFAIWMIALEKKPWPTLTLVVSLEAIFLTSFVLISQNHLEAQARRRAALDLQINLLAEREMTSVLRRVTAIAAHLGLPEDDADDEMKELAEQTDVAVVAQTVETLSPQTAPPSSFT